MQAALRGSGFTVGRQPEGQPADLLEDLRQCRLIERHAGPANFAAGAMQAVLQSPGVRSREQKTLIGGRSAESTNAVGLTAHRHLQAIVCTCTWVRKASIQQSMDRRYSTSTSIHRHLPQPRPASGSGGIAQQRRAGQAVCRNSCMRQCSSWRALGCRASLNTDTRACWPVGVAPITDPQSAADVSTPPPVPGSDQSTFATTCMLRTADAVAPLELMSTRLRVAGPARSNGSS